MENYRFFSQLNFRREFIRYAIVAFSAIIFGVFYTMLRLRGIENDFLFIVLILCALGAGHYTWKLLQSVLYPRDSQPYNQISPVAVFSIYASQYVTASGLILLAVSIERSSTQFPTLQTEQFVSADKIVCLNSESIYAISEN